MVSWRKTDPSRANERADHSLAGVADVHVYPSMSRVAPRIVIDSIRGLARADGRDGIYAAHRLHAFSIRLSNTCRANPGLPQIE
jgi:hypothetical protein